MLKLGENREAQRIVLREAIAATKAKKDKDGNILQPAGAAEPEAFVVMVPITGAMRRRAQRAARALLGDVEDIAEVDIDQLYDVGEAVSRELVRLGVAEWGGIGDAAGKPLALTPDRDTRLATANAPDRPTGTIDLLLVDEDMLERLDAAYVRPDAVRRAEKNGLSASPSGTGGAATQASGTASSPANRKARRAAAKAARTPSTRSKRKTGKKPGTS